MASSGSSSAWVDSTHYVQLRLSWSQVSQDVANNRTTIRLTLQVVTNQYGAMYGSASLPWSISCNGQSVSGTWTIQTGANQTRTIRSWDVTIGHNSDGTKNFSASASVTFNMNFNGWVGAKGVNVSGTLNTIPRASAPSVSGTKQLGSKLTISTNRKSSAFTHTVKWSWAGKSGTIASNVGASCTWTPSVATFAPYLPNAGSATCTITCDTYNGGTKIGTKTTSFTLSIPSSVTPSVSAVTVTDTEGYQAKYGGLVSGKSHITIKVTGVGVYGSTIKSYGKKYNKNSEQSNTTGSFTDAPQAVGSIPIVGSVTDSRGRKASKSITVTVLAYDAPSLSGTTAARPPNDESSTVRVTVKGSTTNLGGKNTNTATVKIDRRQQGTSAWTQVNSADRGITWNYTLDIGGLSSDSVWEIRVTATDQLGTVTQTILTVSTASPIIDLKSNGRGLGIGSVASKDDTVDVGWHLRLGRASYHAFTRGEPGKAGYIRVAQLDMTGRTYGNAGVGLTVAQRGKMPSTLYIMLHSVSTVGEASVLNAYSVGSAGFYTLDSGSIVEAWVQKTEAWDNVCLTNIACNPNSPPNVVVSTAFSETLPDGAVSVPKWIEPQSSTSNRMRISQHAGLGQGIYLQGHTGSAYTNLLGINSSGRTELGWTSGGLGGRVMKTIWTGAWSSGSITVSEAPYYNLFVLDFANADDVVILARNDGGNSLRGTSVHPYVSSNNDDSLRFAAVDIDIDGTKMTLMKALNLCLYHKGNNNTNPVTYLQAINPINRIRGML